MAYERVKPIYLKRRGHLVVTGMGGRKISKKILKQ
jgi:hypothetical protein